MENTPASTDGIDDLQRRVKQARSKTSALETEFRSFDVKDRLESALGVVAQTMFDLSRRLNVERPDAALRLDITHLTVIRFTNWDAVRTVYRMIFDTVRDLGDRLQVIVLDHANLHDPPEFQTAVRARWREGLKLI